MQKCRFPRTAVPLVLSLVLLIIATPHQAFGYEARPLVLNPTSVAFGSVTVGSSQTQVEGVTNTRSYPIVIRQAAISGTGFSLSGLNLPLQLSSKQTATLNLGFTPPSAGSFSGTLQISFKVFYGGRWRYGTVSAALSGSGTGASQGQLTASPTSMNFGSVQVSKTNTLPLTLTNSQSTTVQVSQLAASGTGFSVSGFTLPINLSAGQSVTLSASFTPPASGTDSGSITVTSNANNPSLSVSLVGSGAVSGQLAVSPTTLSFGTVNVGSSKNMTGTLSASTNSVTVSSASWNGPGFSVSGLSFPVTLAAGQSLPFTVTFAPQSSGSASGLVSFVSNAGNSPSNESLTGSGAQATQHSVGLSWSPDASTVQGYYVYRGAQSGGPYARISTLLPSTAYTDTAVVSSQTYFYVVTALGTNSLESGYSNEATAVVP